MDSNRHALQTLSGTVKAVLARIPGLGEALAGWQAYNDSKFRRNFEKVINLLQDKVDDLQELFSNEWINSEEGRKFARKIFDSAFDAQLEEKQDIFINALINGIKNKDISYLRGNL